MAIVHGERKPNTGAVQQRILFTLYSRPEAPEALGRGTKGGGDRFRQLLEEQYPDLKFNWKKIRRTIQEHLDALPDRYEYRSQRLRARFQDDLTRQWERAAGAAQRTLGLAPAGGFVAAFAYFELGQREQALVAFLHGALNHPGAARMLASEKTRGKHTATSRDEAEDHNTGVSLLRGLHAYVHGQSRVSRRFFRDVIRDARVVRLLDESVAVVFASTSRPVASSSGTRHPRRGPLRARWPARRCARRGRECSRNARRPLRRSSHRTVR